MVDNDSSEFHPEQLPRRGELNAWLMAVVVGISLGILHRTLGLVPSWAWIFWGFLAFSALSISFGNWMDRKTRIVKDGNGIRFENGIRQVGLSWPEVQKVSVHPARWGKVVRVVGKTSHFEFKTLGEVHFQGEMRGRTGFKDGETILDTIIRKSDLELVEKKDTSYYYARS